MGSTRLNGGHNGMTTLSAYVPAPLWAVGEVTPVERLTLIAIASLKDGLWGTVKWFASFMGMDRSQVSKAITRLINKGALRRETRGRRQIVVVDEAWVKAHQQTIGVPGVTQQGPLTEATEMRPAANADCSTNGALSVKTVISGAVTDAHGECGNLPQSGVANDHRGVAICHTEIQEEKSIYTRYISMGSVAIVTTYDETGRLLTSEPCDPDYARAHADAMADASNKNTDTHNSSLKDSGKPQDVQASSCWGAVRPIRARLDDGNGKTADSAGAPKHKWSVQVPFYDDVKFCLIDHFRMAVDRASEVAKQVVDHYTANGRNWRRGKYRIQVKDLPTVLMPWADRERQSQPMPRSGLRTGGYKDADGWTYYRDDNFIACPRDMPPPATMEVA